jgi:DNA-binding winged helix-turn-helix (wHTH) protein
VPALEGARSGTPAPGPDPAVEILRWPAQAGRRGDLHGGGRACLWLLDAGELAPELGPNEDWVRLPVDERDLQARVQRLAGRATGRTGLSPHEVAVGDDGLLRFGPGRVAVPPIEATILNRLAETPERVVTRDELVKLIWNDEPRTRRVLDSRVHTLRERIAHLGLCIHTIRGHGFLLAAGPDPSKEPATRRAAPRRPSWSSS